MPNVVELHQFNTVVEPAHEEVDFHSPSLVETHTSVQTEQLWQKRLRMFVRAERALMKMNRWSKLTGVFTVASTGYYFFHYTWRPRYHLRYFSLCSQQWFLVLLLTPLGY